jgi:hypothetical protein
MRRTRATAGGMVVLVAMVAAGCGGGDSTGATDDTQITTAASQPTAPATTKNVPTPTPTTPKPTMDVGKLPAKQVLTKAQAAAKAAASVHVKGAMTDGADRMGLDLRLTKTAGSGSVTVNGDTISLIVIGRTAYLKMSDSFWRHQSKSKAEANAAIQLIDGRWIKTSLDDKDWRDFAMLGTKTEFFDSLFEDTGSLRKIKQRTVDGVACVGLGDSDGTLWVERSTARPVRIESPGKSGTDALSFTEYNQVKTPKAPAADQTIDGDALGN